MEDICDIRKLVNQAEECMGTEWFVRDILLGSVAKKDPELAYQIAVRLSKVNRVNRKVGIEWTKHNYPNLVRETSYTHKELVPAYDHANDVIKIADTTRLSVARAGGHLLFFSKKQNNTCRVPVFMFNIPIDDVVETQTPIAVKNYDNLNDWNDGHIALFRSFEEPQDEEYEYNEGWSSPEPFVYKIDVFGPGEKKVKRRCFKFTDYTGSYHYQIDDEPYRVVLRRAKWRLEAFLQGGTFHFLLIFQGAEDGQRYNKVVHFGSVEGTEELRMIRTYKSLEVPGRVTHLRPKIFGEKRLPVMCVVEFEKVHRPCIRGVSPMCVHVIDLLSENIMAIVPLSIKTHHACVAYVVQVAGSLLSLPDVGGSVALVLVKTHKQCQLTLINRPLAIEESLKAQLEALVIQYPNVAFNYFEALVRFRDDHDSLRILNETDEMLCCSSSQTNTLSRKRAMKGPVALMDAM